MIFLGRKQRRKQCRLEGQEVKGVFDTVIFEWRFAVSS